MHAKSQQNLAPTARPRHPTVLSIPLLLNHSERSKSSQLRSVKIPPHEKHCISSSDFSSVCLHSHTQHSTSCSSSFACRTLSVPQHSVMLKAPNYLPRNLKPPKKHPHHLLCCYILLPEVAQTKQSESTSTKTSCPN